MARLDAEAAYGDLDDSRITIARQPDGWHISTMNSWMQCTTVAGLTPSSLHGAADPGYAV
jgi:hypothetical protein